MKKIFFASDFHLGGSNKRVSRTRERKVISWLRSIEAEAEAIFLVGDIFDFWFEYRHVVPKGFVRLFATLADFVEKGIDVHVFVGNHDLWMKEYLTDELGIVVHHHPYEVQLHSKKFFIAHGDGLGPGDHKYKVLKKIFTNRLCQWLFSWVHPDLGMKLALFSSTKSRESQEEPEYFLGKDKEWLLIYANYKLKKQSDIDCFVFGHRHLPLDVLLENKLSRYINLGDWINYCTYLEFDGVHLQLKAYGQPAFDYSSIKH